jgi:hypothetical protein
MLYLLYQQKERGDTMSANVYNVQSLLVGKEYRSNTLTGKIVNAEPHPKAVWYDGCESYLVEVQPNNRISTTYRTVAVKVSD